MHIMLRPDLKTTGGEVHDILLEQRYVGTLSLVYREGERVCGSVQLEEGSLDEANKPAVLAFVSQYVQGLAGALSAPKCDVFVSYSPFETILSSSDEIEEQLERHEWFPNETANELEEEGWSVDQNYALRLELISAGRNISVYDVYSSEDELVAVAVLKQSGAEVAGEVRWCIRPAEEEMDVLISLLAEDLDDQLMDTICIEMKLGQSVIETFELVHEQEEDTDEFGNEERDEAYVAYEDEGEAAEDESSWTLHSGQYGSLQSGYSAQAVRDDASVLTYAIYHEKTGAIPVAITTVDIGNAELSGFVELDVPGTTEDRAEMATMILHELDKVLDYDRLHLTWMFHNQVIDEIQFENESV